MSERITGHTELCGLMAYPIRHSGSPAMHNEAFAKLGIDYAYLAFEIDADEIEAGVQAFRTLKMRGMNVSMPNKTLIGKYLDELTPIAELCGAVNTVVNNDGHLIGTITDGTGFMAAAKDNNMSPVGKKMTIAGCGGAGTAVQMQAAFDGVKELSIFNRKDEFYARGEKTVQQINENTDCKATLYDLADLDALRREMAESFLFANATSAGMKPQEGVSVIPDSSYFSAGLNVIDIIYSPAETELLRLAKAAGCRTMNGRGMMLFQGSASFELWTGQPMPIEYMKEVLNINYDE